MNEGKHFVVGFNQYGIVRVRIKNNTPYTKDQKNALRLELTNTENTGHMDAFTYKCNQEDTLKEAQRVIHAIQKHMFNS